MTSWLIRPAAEADLTSIWDYSVETWGIAQARRYLGDIERAFTDLCDSPIRGRPFSELKGGLWRYPCGSHVILYERTDQGITIVRVLHNTRDIPSHIT